MAGDFCRRFFAWDILMLQETFNETQLSVWRSSTRRSWTSTACWSTTDRCKQGMYINHNGQWGYPPLVVSLAATDELLYLASRSGNRPRNERAAVHLDRAIDYCRQAGFPQHRTAR